MTGNSTNKVGISIIIPLLNEELYVEKCIKILHQHILGRNTEIIFIDGGSEDKSILLIENFSHHKLIKSKSGRAIQMNLGAKEARYPILYFLHIDSIPPKGFDQIIEEQINNGIKAGCFQIRFEPSHWALSITSFFTRFNWKICRGGDQSLFIEKTLFEEMKGFNEHYPICEDNEFTDRLYQSGNFKVVDRVLISSSRRFNKNGVLFLLFLHGIIHLMRFLGVSPIQLNRFYRHFVK